MGALLSSLWPRSTEPPPLTKSQLRKLRRQQRREERFAARKEWGKKKKAAKREERRAALERVAAGETDVVVPRLRAPRPPKVRRKEIQIVGPTVVIDLSFHNLMREGEHKSLANQVNFAYAVNRRLDKSLRMALTSVEPEFEHFLARFHCENWTAVEQHRAAYADVFDRDSLVYLSADSENVLHTLDASKVYVIGGLIDHNQHKGLCHRLATEAGIATARLPIDDYIDIKTRKVLAVNHVFEILARYAQDDNWEQAMMAVMPERKGAKVKRDGHPDQAEAEREHESEPLLDGADSDPDDVSIEDAE